MEIVAVVVRPLVHVVDDVRIRSMASCSVSVGRSWIASCGIRMAVPPLVRGVAFVGTGAMSRSRRRAWAALIAAVESEGRRLCSWMRTARRGLFLCSILIDIMH